MITRKIHSWLGVAGLLAGGAAAGAGDPLDDRALLDRAAADRAPAAAAAAPVAPAAGDALAAAEREARLELQVAEIRLETVMARRAAQANRWPEAATRAQRVLALVQGMPVGVDVSVFELQAEGLLAKAARSGVDPAALRTVTLSPQTHVPAATPIGAPAAEAPGPISAVDDARDRGAAHIGRTYDGADTPDVDTTGDAAALRARAVANQDPESRGYRPAIEVFAGRSIAERDMQRVEYEGALRETYTADEAARLTHADEARIAGDAIVTFPDNWQAQKARRTAYADGAIARSAPWTGGDGKQWHAAIYDISDLTYVPPDFQLREGLTPTEAYWRAIALDSLIHNSEIFTGFAEDLAAGLPLLRFFGAPLDDFEMRGPKYSAERAERIAELVRRFTTPSTEAKVEVLAP